MAITNAQQYKQLLAKGGRIGFKGGADMGTVSTPTRTATAKSVNISPSGNVTTSRDRGPEGPDDRSSDLQTINQLKNQNRFVAEEDDLLPGDTLTTEDIKLNKREQGFKDFLNRRNKVNLFGASKLFTGPAQAFSDFNASINRPFFENVIRAGKIPGVNFGTLVDEEDYEKAYQKYMSNRLAGNIDAYGNPLRNNYYDSSGNLVVVRDDGPDPILPKKDTDDDDDDDTTTPPSTGVFAGIAPQFAGSIFDFDKLRANAMDGGMIEDTPVGGIMDLESGRQMYFLGKLVKKAGRAIKKVVKSPFGKAALGAALTFGIPGTSFGGLMGKAGGLSGLKAKLFGEFGGKANMTKGLLGKLGITGGGGAMKPTLGGGITLGLGIPFALDLLGVGKDDDDNSAYEQYMRDMRLDIPALRARRNLAAAFDGSTYNYEDYAVGGRAGYQEGGDAEPVAKKTMPLIDMDGKEKDYRETGGFVDMGRMERADDVPARLSKNEFVFTADAVRNAGDGDIDKGAEVMYNMMKNLEGGGDVSEESQGLEGAKKMFQTSQRLGEVI